MTLDDYVAQALGERFRWGVADCCTFAAGWVLHQTGVDPMFRWRRRYATEGEALWLLGPLGLAHAFRRGCQHAGLGSVGGDWRDGDVGLVETQRGPAAALRLGAFWLARDIEGVSYHREARSVMGLR